MSGTFYAIANEPSHATQSYTRTLRGVRAPIFLVTILVDTFRRPWELDLAVALPKAVNVDMLLLIHWHIWKTRNGRVFERQVSSLVDILRRILKDIDA